MNDALAKTLVLTTRKSFWASQESSIFPHILTSVIFYGHSTNRFNSLFLFARALVALVVRRPKIVVVGSAVRLMNWMALLKKWKLFDFKLICINKLYRDDLHPYVDKCICYSTYEIENRYTHLDPTPFEFAHLPVDGDYSQYDNEPAGFGEKTFFAGGSASRDYDLLLQVIPDIRADFTIMTKLKLTDSLPKNCRVLGPRPTPEFLNIMSQSMCVIVPVKMTDYAQGQTTMVQAMRMGKILIISDNPSVRDYVEHNQTGIVVPVGDKEALKEAINNVLNNPEQLFQMAQKARERARTRFSYQNFADQLSKSCQVLLS